MRRKSSELPNRTAGRLAGMGLAILVIMQFPFFSAYAQSDPGISISMEDVTVEDVILRIEKESQYRFLYSTNTVDIARKVSITSDNESITVILARLFKNTDVEWELKGNKVILSKKIKKRTPYRKSDSLFFSFSRRPS